MKIEDRKKALRNEIRERAKKYSREWIEAESAKITEHIIKSQAYQNAEVIFCYVSTGKEVNTFEILEDAFRRGKKVGVPLCLEKGRMEVRQIHSMQDLCPGAYGILEPKPETDRISGEEITYGIIPCVTCDKKGNRMGHGAGYYDRYLEGLKLKKVIVCFDEMMAEEIPMTELDIRMDQVVSQSQMIEL